MRLRYGFTSAPPSTAARYLPDNYCVAGVGEWIGLTVTVFVGLDAAGWTMDAYVIPRLGSGGYATREIDAVEACAILGLDEPSDLGGFEWDGGFIGNVLSNDGSPYGEFASIAALPTPYALHDTVDPDDGPLFWLYGDADGATVYAPLCNDVAELERRVIRCLGMDVTIDDHGPSTAVAL